MIDLKKYVSSNIDMDKLSPSDADRFARFNRYFDFINDKFKDNNMYNYFMYYYLSMGKPGINYIIILICLISYDDRILNQGVETIDDIVIYLDKIHFYLYEQYLKVCLLDVVTDWLNVFRDLKYKRKINIDINVIFTMIFGKINIKKRRRVLEKDINKLLEYIYDIFDPYKKDLWFDSSFTIADIYRVMKIKMEHVEEVVSFTGLNIFTDEFENLERMQELNNKDARDIQEFKEEILKLDGLDLSDSEKIIYISSVVKYFVKENQGVSKKISFEEMNKKSENR